jgi:hypothetical protein
MRQLEEQRRTLQSRPEIASVRSYYNVTGNHVTGSLICEGETTELAQLLGDEEFVQQSVRFQSLFTDWNTSLFYGGENPEDAERQIGKIYRESATAV